MNGPGARWAMTDRGSAALSQAPEKLGIGASAMEWDGTRLSVKVDEPAWPPLPGIGGRIRGRVTVIPDAITEVELPLDPEGIHIWRPFAPSARIEVALEKPEWRWQGHGYFDANFGARPLEADFRRWAWSRFPTREGAVCLYDAERRDGSALAAAMAFDARGRARMIEPPPLAPLPRTLWRLPRQTRADKGHEPREVRRLLDAPFYARAAVTTRLLGEETLGVHEELALHRYVSPIVKAMLAFRVPRRRGKA
jgi:carotenoid 1,2-hydratase